ncbi:MAG: NADH-quinone oxidoreductase subunit J [Bacteroidota bacterium]|nr:NADH-quinone oxidoreductase subunit J [Bacteroidota bacterium]
MLEIAFYILSSLAIFSALMVVFSRNPVHSVLYLIITFFAISGHYALLNAQFLAVVNLIVYAGAIMVLFLFVVMLLNLNADAEKQKPNTVKFAAVISGGLLLLVLVAAVRGMESFQPNLTNQLVNTGSFGSLAAHDSNIGLVKQLGKVLYSKFMLPFEISSILFLAAMVGAVLIGKKNLNA